MLKNVRRQWMCALLMGVAVAVMGSSVLAVPSIHPHTEDPDGHLDIEDTTAIHHPTAGTLVFTQHVAGTGGGLVPDEFGPLDGAPVLGYVFPTTLALEDVGFGGVAGIVALVLTSHPDFDDTPLVDESGDGLKDNDGGLYHSHWVVLVQDTDVHDSFFVAPFDNTDPDHIVPVTHPGLPIFIDSPNYFVEKNGSSISVQVPVAGVNGQKNFNFDAVTAYMEVHTADGEPLLGVYHVYDVFSGDLSLPFQVQTIPEPITATLGLMGLGVLGLATRRRSA